MFSQLTSSACFSSSVFTGDGLRLSEGALCLCLGEEVSDLRLWAGDDVSDLRRGPGDTDFSLTSLSSSSSSSESYNNTLVFFSFLQCTVFLPNFISTCSLLF